MSTIIIITPPPKRPKSVSAKIQGAPASSYEVDVGEGATDLETLKALVLRLESEQE